MEEKVIALPRALALVLVSAYLILLQHLLTESYGTGKHLWPFLLLAISLVATVVEYWRFRSSVRFPVPFNARLPAAAQLALSIVFTMCAMAVGGILAFGAIPLMVYGKNAHFDAFVFFVRAFNVGAAIFNGIWVTYGCFLILAFRVP